MKIGASCIGLFVVLLNVASLPAANESEALFRIRLEGVKFDYPGAEQWAEIERPDGRRVWVFAVYTGKGEWTVPVREPLAGKFQLLRVERRAGDKRTDLSIAKDSPLTLELKRAAKPLPTAPQQKPLVEAGEATTFFTADDPW